MVLQCHVIQSEAPRAITVHPPLFIAAPFSTFHRKIAISSCSAITSLGIVRVFLAYFEHQYGVCIDAVDDPPVMSAVSDSNRTASRPNDGRDGMLKRKRFTLKEPNPSSGGRFGLINLLEPLGTHHDAVAYAMRRFAFTVWVNGKRVFGFEEYRNGVRNDRHRFKAMLKEGDNTVLVKICQAPLDPSSPEPNWEFLLRVVRPDGSGLRFEQP